MIRLATGRTRGNSDQAFVSYDTYMYVLCRTERGREKRERKREEVGSRGFQKKRRKRKKRKWKGKRGNAVLFVNICTYK